jgi:hypothetical protein
MLMCASPSPPPLHIFPISSTHTFFLQEVSTRASSLHKRVGQAGAWAGRHRAERAAAQAQEQVAVLMHRVVVRGKSRVRAWVERQDYNHRAVETEGSRRMSGVKIRGGLAPDKVGAGYSDGCAGGTGSAGKSTTCTCVRAVKRATAKLAAPTRPHLFALLAHTL